MNNKALSEEDICDRYITPALRRAAWESKQWHREYYFADGKIIVRGKLRARGKRKRIDYLLFHKPAPERCYLCFGVCASALAAADFSALVLFGFASTFPAADAAFAPV